MIHTVDCLFVFFVESSTDVRVEFEEPLMTGTLVSTLFAKLYAS